MKLAVRPGKYVVAVSGGVDSMVLLDLLRRNAKLTLVVAHFDHGIRPDSAEDRILVGRIARHYGLPFYYKTGKLGPQASEAEAREARYAFLRKIQAEHNADAIVTAHHQDDMLETAIINLLRGTGRKGLSSLTSQKQLVRPLLKFTKKDIRAYARERHLLWREDGSNADERYLRNYIRKYIMPKFDEEDKSALLERIKHAGKTNAEIDALLEEDLKKQPANDELNRGWYLQLPYVVASEMMASWLRRNGIGQFDRTLIDHLVVASKTAKPGKKADVDKGHILEFTRDTIKLILRDGKPSEEK